MAEVKGSKQFRMVVVPYRPLRKVMLSIIFMLLVVAACFASYYGGQRLANEELTSLREGNTRLQLELTKLDSAHSEAQQQLANLRLGAEVDQQANEDVREEVLALKSQIAKLEEDITFYRGLMAPTADKQGLSIGTVNIVATGQPRHFEYTLVFQQLATNHQLLNGYVNITVVGYEAGISKRIPLKLLSADITDEDIKLRFKYFQTLSGQLVLPESFEPESIDVVAVATGRNSARVEQKYGWLVQQP